MTSQPWDCGFEPFNYGVTSCDERNPHNYNTSNGWFQEKNPRMIYASYEDLFHNQAKIIMFLKTKQRLKMEAN